MKFCRDINKEVFIEILWSDLEIKKIPSPFLGNILERSGFEVFLVQTCLGPLGDKYVFMTYA